MPKRKHNKIRINTTVESQTGEVENESFSYSYDVNVDHKYFKIYRESELILRELPEKTRKVLDYFLFRIEYGTNEFYLKPANKDELSNALNCSIDAINKKIKKLINYGILIKIKPSVFCINAYLFGFGASGDLDKLRGDCDYLPSHVLTSIKKDRLLSQNKNYTSKKQLVANG